jgi:hypothetical protein
MNKQIPEFVAVASAQVQRRRDPREDAECEAERMRQLYVRDPISLDVISCASLADRERQSWSEYDRQWPGGVPAPGSPDREPAIVAQRAGRWRARALQRGCGVRRVRVG